MERIDGFLSTVPYNDADLVATKMNRGITSHPESWDALAAIAQRVVGHFQNEPEVVEELYVEMSARPLIAASRLFYGAALAAARERENPEYASATIRLAWLAMAAYASHGNLPAANACAIKFSVHPASAGSGALLASYALFVPSAIGEILSIARGTANPTLHALLEAMNAFAAKGDELFASNARAAMHDMLRKPASPFEISLLRSGRLALQHQLALATAHILKTYTELGTDIVEMLSSQCSPTLLPPQRTAIVNGFLLNRRNTLVTLPTSTGKTLLALLALITGVLRNQSTGVFVAPYVTVARQATDFLRLLVRGLPIRVLSASDADNRALAGLPGAQIIIGTPERFNDILDSSLRIDDIQTVVFDEAHLVENGVRGALLEGLLTRLRLRQLGGNECRIILMSAVLANSHQLREWIGIEPRDHVLNEWRPTARRIALWTQNGQLQYLFGADPLKPSYAQATTILGARSLPLVEAMNPTDAQAGLRAQRPRANRNVAYLIDFLLSEIGGPALCVCMTKNATRGVTRALAARLPEIELGETLTELRTLIIDRYPHLRDLLSCVGHGVAYHNAALPAHVRRLIEKAVGTRELVAVASTTTLAEGADLPFRLTILYDWLQWTGDSQQPMSSLLFRNIAGRSGRAGSFVEGDTIIFDNVLGDLRFTRDSVRRTSVLDIIRAEPTLCSAFELAESDPAKRSIEATFSADFVAAIDENPENPNLADDYVKLSYSGSVRVSSRMAQAIRQAKLDVLDATAGEPMGIAASPIRLTPFGQAVRHSGLSPTSARRLCQFLNENNDDDPDAAVASLLLGAGQYPELGSEKVRKLLNGARPGPNQMVRVGDLGMIGRQWRAGTPLTQMFAALPAVVRSQRSPKIEAWLVGQPAETWDEPYDNFLDFAEAVFGGYAPLLLRACAQLQPFTNIVRNFDWTALRVEYERRADPQLAEL